MTDPADVWEAYCAETPAKDRSPQGALAFAFWRARADAFEEIAKLHESEAQHYYQRRDPGTANGHRSWAKRVRQMGAMP